MRIILIILVCLAGLARAQAGPSVVFEAATGEIISAERAGEPWYPASLTKLMTAYVVFQKLKSGALKLDQQIPVTALAAKQPASKIGLPEAHLVSVDFALQALLVYSANDMAYVLAEAAGGSVPAFVREMNGNAERFGLTGTYFANPNGLFDARQVTTARDMGVLAAIILHEFPEYSHYFAQDFLAAGKRKLANRNGLLRRLEAADGMKTGFICNSGFNLVASATVEGRQVIAVIFGAPNTTVRINLADTLLTAALSQGKQGGKGFIGEIANQELGTLVPADLTAQVCRNKPEVTIGDAASLSGWGLSLGRYETAKDADKALRGRMIGARRLIDGGTSGVIEIPGTQGYHAMVWDLEQPVSLKVCAEFGKVKAYCDVLPPELLGRIVALAPKSPPPAAVAEGSEEVEKAKPARRTKAKAKTSRKRIRWKGKTRP